MSLVSLAVLGRRVATRGQWRLSSIALRSMSKSPPSFWQMKKLPINTVINFVPHRYVWVVERFGKFYRMLDSGLNFLLPLIDRIRYIQSLKEVTVEIPHQSAITLDNVTLNIDGVLYYRVVDPYKASYGVENAEFAIVQLAQTTMRSELGKMTMDKVFQERTTLNDNIVSAINHAAEVWGCLCLRYEIRDIALPAKVKEAMQMQVEAERKKRAKVLESEGVRESEINIAEGDKRSRILSSEGEKMQAINRAEDAFKELAKTTNTVILPPNTGDVASAVAQAMGIYTHMNQKSGLPPLPATPELKSGKATMSTSTSSESSSAESTAATPPTN